MSAKCPKCGRQAPQGNNYVKLLQRAEAGELELICDYCGPWKPSTDDQKLYAAALRRHIEASR